MGISIHTRLTAGPELDSLIYNAIPDWAAEERRPFSRELDSSWRLATYIPSRLELEKDDRTGEWLGRYVLDGKAHVARQDTPSLVVCEAFLTARYDAMKEAA